MARKKRKRFAELQELPNVFDRYSVTIRKAWNERFFANRNPLSLELGCGRGEYTLELARRFSDRNFVGVDRNGARLWKGARQALQDNLTNVAFLRNRVEVLDDFFEAGQIEEIWLPFSDPLRKRKQAKHRLTSPRFLDLYGRLLRPGGVIHFKTDDAEFFSYSLHSAKTKRYPVLKMVEDVHGGAVENELIQIATTYEKRHLEKGRRIYYLCLKAGGELEG